MKRLAVEGKGSSLTRIDEAKQILAVVESAKKSADSEGMITI